MAKKKRDTPAHKVRRRRDPAIIAPPPRIVGVRGDAIHNVRLYVGGRQFVIADHIEGDTPWSLGMDQTGTITLPVRDPTGSLEPILQDEELLQEQGVRCQVSGVSYYVSGVDHDEGLYTLTLEDEVSWRLKQFTSFKSASRARVTRFGFIQSLADEAQRAPYARLRTFIPEIDDKQPIAPVKKGA